MAPRRGEPSQMQNGNRRRREVSESEDDSDEAEYDNANRATQGGSSDAEIEAMASQLVRFALFSEYKRRPLRRADIVQNAFPQHARSFNRVMQVANRQLRDVFGMEIVELRARNKAPTAAETLAQTQKGKGRANQTQTREGDEDDAETQTQSSKTAKSNTYILRSTLSPELLSLMNDPRPLTHLIHEQDEYREREDHPDSGAMLRWEKADGTNSGHVALLGIRTVILSLILCSGRMMQDDHLHALLRRLNLERETILPYNSPDNKEPSMTLDKYLDLLAKQNYLEKTKIMGPGGQEEGAVVEWRWGNREAEFSERAAAQFIEAIFVEGLEESEDEAEDQGQQSRRARRDVEAEKAAKRKRLHGDIAKAAGSELRD